jgi:hypothetical protein
MHGVIAQVAEEIAAVVGEALAEVEFADLVERVVSARMTPAIG